MKSGCKSMVLVALVCLLVGALSNPVKRAGKDLEARRRSAIDRSMIRFGRSFPPEPSAAEIRETFNRPTRKSNSFLRFGKSQPLALTTEELLTLLRSYDQDYDEPMSKRSSNFIRLGRDPMFIRLGRGPSFIRYGRSADDEKEQGSELVVSGYPQRINRAKAHQFIRLGRDSEELNDNSEEEATEEQRKKREICNDCES